MNYFYLGEDQKPIGPLPLNALQTLAANGVIKPDTFVIQEGSASWTRWRDLDLSGAEEPPDEGRRRPTFWELLQRETDQTLLVRFLDLRLDRLRKPGGQDRFAVGFQHYARVITNLGSYAVLAAGVLMLLWNVVLAIRINSGTPILYGLEALLGSVVMHYLAARFSCANERLLDRSPVTLPTDVIPRTLSLLSLIAGVSFLVWGLIEAIRSFDASLRAGLMDGALGLLAAVLAYHVHLICSFPKHLLNVECVDNGAFRAGEYYANLVKFSARLLLRMGALLFGYGMLAVLAALVVNGTSLAGPGTRLDPSTMSWEIAATAVAWGLLPLLPIIIHFLYLLAVLAADLVSAVFEIERNTAPRPSSPPTDPK